MYHICTVKLLQILLLHCLHSLCIQSVSFGYCIANVQCPNLLGQKQTTTTKQRLARYALSYGLSTPREIKCLNAEQ